MHKAEREAARLLRKYSPHAPPISVEEISRAEGAEIVRHRFEGTESGFALREGGRWIIGVNTLTSRRRQRFTVAHELGHLLLHPGDPLIVDRSIRVNKRDDVSSTGTDLREIQANAFAATLLMPYVLVAQQASVILEENSRTSRDEFLAQLARAFDVSVEAMGFRLVNLGILVP